MNQIMKYTTQYESQLFQLLESEGPEWGDYWQEPHKGRYIEALAKSETYVIFENDALVGYARTLNDYMIWVIDLLVNKDCRGKGYGKLLMEHVCKQYPEKGVYVLGADDVLPYYEKLGYKAEGVVYKVTKGEAI